MDRRTFNKLTGLAAIGAFSGRALEADAEQTAPHPGGDDNWPASSVVSNEVVLEDQETLIAFDADSGALTITQAACLAAPILSPIGLKKRVIR